jgi:16S rRNA (guanine(966)-N(2))-methyltransferase RsmD
VSKQFVRIIGGEFRGRQIPCEVHLDLRPTPDRVREALFNILFGHLTGRPFFDVFAGTGVVGLEAIGRGAKESWFVELDGKNASSIQKLAEKFGISPKARLIRADVYRWLEHWAVPKEPVVLFFSPPFPDLDKRPEALITGVDSIVPKLAPGSVLIVQSEDGVPLPWYDDSNWDCRKYGRNWLLIRKIPEIEADEPDGESPDPNR